MKDTAGAFTCTTAAVAGVAVRRSTTAHAKTPNARIDRVQAVPCRRFAVLPIAVRRNLRAREPGRLQAR
jgi:hypothetical protein